MWPSITTCVHRSIYSYLSCQRVRSVTQRPFGTIEPLTIPEEPWKLLSWNSIPGSPLPDRFNSILKVIHLADKDGTLHEIYREYESWATGQPNFQKHMKVSLHIQDHNCVWPRKCIHLAGHKRNQQAPWYPTTPGSSVPPKDQWTIRYCQQGCQALHTSTWYYQDDWETPLPIAKFVYNNNNHISRKVSLFKAN